ncbi:DUF3606 domain-containing protein [Mucilaginibacter sp.]|jgi:hypothetical protein|uniref:DUF3606 domain-containing protein n=1 Tax=Mucilaginibacter sp. TaxID=1882438 RepID=UPI00261212AB|nr:DUF3606 domain-containing protein [Mucilaginibacter sp.]
MQRKIKAIQPDARSINIEDQYAPEFWASKLKVSQTKLKDEVEAVGPSAVDVKRELKK